MLKLLMLPMTIAIMSVKMTVSALKWMMSYRVVKVMILFSLVTAAIQYAGFQMSLVDETLIILTVGVIAGILLFGPPAVRWWNRRRDMAEMRDRKREAERENRL